MLEDQADRGEKRAHAVDGLLARVPPGPPIPAGSTQWFESDRSKTDPHEGMGVELTVRERLNFKGPVYFSEHHLSHAASAFFCSPFEGFPRAVCCTTKTSDYRSSSIADQSASRLSTIHSELL